ncbi:ankyrin repeat-containing domain protein [Aspergillus similis]
MGSSLSRVLFDLVYLAFDCLFGGDLLGFIHTCYWIPHACYVYLYAHRAAFLIFAAKRGSVFLTRKLIEAGADVQWESDFWVERRRGLVSWNTNSKEHPISYAAMLGHTALISLLLQHGADIEYKDRRGCSPLLLAALNNHVSAAGLLISRGADLLVKNMNGHSPISAALRNGSDETLRLLLGALESHSPDYVSRGLQVLLIAASGNGGHIGWIQYALSRGAHVNYRESEHDSTALLVAARTASLATVKFLLENGADPNVKKLPVPGLRWVKTIETPLLLAARNVDHGESIIRLLLNHGANSHGPDAYLALLTAVERGDVSLFRLLADNGAPLERPRHRLRSLESTALMSGQTAILDLLLEMGLSPSAEDLEFFRNRK